MCRAAFGGAFDPAGCREIGFEASDLAAAILAAAPVLPFLWQLPWLDDYDHFVFLWRELGEEAD
jgi:hypothetical protein